MAINTHRLLIDFATPDGLIHFMDRLVDSEMIPEDAVARDAGQASDLDDTMIYVIEGGKSYKHIKLP